MKKIILIIMVLLISSSVFALWTTKEPKYIPSPIKQVFPCEEPNFTTQEGVDICVTYEPSIGVVIKNLRVWL